jgi:hypothetical protein
MTSVPNATILTPAQISYYAQNAGFSGQDLLTAVAIALAESGGNPGVYNPETAAGTPGGEGSYGLWQIYLHAHPEYAYANLYDPQTNANAAFDIHSLAGGFSPWSTYNSRAYQAHLAPAASAVPSMPGLTSAAVDQLSPIPSNLSMGEVLMIAAIGLLGIFVVGLLE